ncbi:hypothetical protein LINPERHAP2_LOCUS28939 [Linum perenne]
MMASILSPTHVGATATLKTLARRKWMRL